MKIIKKFKKIVYRDYFFGKTKIRNRLGLALLLRYGNYIDRKIILNEDYERRQIDAFIALLNSNDVRVFLDIGANFGLYSLTVARQGVKVDRIFAFEPDRDNYNNLCGNIFINSLSHKIRTFPLGLSNRNATVKFLKNAGKSSGTSRILETAPESTKAGQYSEVEIEVAPLDSLVSGNCGESIAMKVDVEGHELMVLEGARSLLAGNRCLLQIEILENARDIIDRVCREFQMKFYGRIDSDCYFANYDCHINVAIFDKADI
ncbi:MAG: FkbM family methyltransferase [Desulfuromonadales bacterium]|nr:FkbM family methyltransferase [Desulfuromonadales bacterium]